MVKYSGRRGYSEVLLSMTAYLYRDHNIGTILDYYLLVWVVYRTHTHTHTHVCIYIYMCIYMYLHAYTATVKNVCTDLHMPARVHTHSHSRPQT